LTFSLIGGAPINNVNEEKDDAIKDNTIKDDVNEEKEKKEVNKLDSARSSVPKKYLIFANA